MKSIKKCVLCREVIMVPFPGSITDRIGQITKEKRKKIDFFGFARTIYWGIPNACFVPGNRQ